MRLHIVPSVVAVLALVASALAQGGDDVDSAVARDQQDNNKPGSGSSSISGDSNSDRDSDRDSDSDSDSILVTPASFHEQVEKADTKKASSKKASSKKASPRKAAKGSKSKATAEGASSSSSSSDSASSASSASSSSSSGLTGSIVSTSSVVSSSSSTGTAPAVTKTPRPRPKTKTIIRTKTETETETKTETKTVEMVAYQKQVAPPHYFYDRKDKEVPPHVTLPADIDRWTDAGRVNIVHCFNQYDLLDEEDYERTKLELYQKCHNDKKISRVHKFVAGKGLVQLVFNPRTYWWSYTNCHPWEYKAVEIFMDAKCGKLRSAKVHYGYREYVRERTKAHGGDYYHWKINQEMTNFVFIVNTEPKIVGPTADKHEGPWWP